jgi:2-dehydro-3-deoxy-D-arabinonate dehydratase
MRIYNTTRGIIIENNESFFLSKRNKWDKFVNRKNLHKKINKEIEKLEADNSLAELINTHLLPPIGTQEIWAAGVTYIRSREARMEESKDAGGGDFYARVYDAERPELFFKSPAYRSVGSRQAVRIRKDSKWNVPEPELTLFVSSKGSIEGYTIGNDMSSRDIEGENPLYLPQAKSYNASAALGPCLYVPEKPINPDAVIIMEILRNESTIFSGEISINRMKRQHNELVEYLFRETSFPNGTYLMTGTGIIPAEDFTLDIGDEIRISIEGIGTLTNSVSS